MSSAAPKHRIALPDGRTMLQHVLAALRQVCAPPVVILSGSDDRARSGSDENRDADLRHLGDLRPGLGPLAGIEALLASGIASEYLLCACDTPRLTAPLLAKLLAAMLAPMPAPAPSPSHPAPAALAAAFRIRGRSTIESLPLRISAQALPVVRAHLDRNQRSLWRAVMDCRPHIVELDPRDAALLVNVNTAEDLDALRLPPGAA